MSAHVAQKIQAHISHSFVIGKTTLPPGDYTFLMQHNNENNMLISNDNLNKTISFIISRIRCSF